MELPGATFPPTQKKPAPERVTMFDNMEAPEPGHASSWILVKG